MSDPGGKASVFVALTTPGNTEDWTSCTLAMAMSWMYSHGVHAKIGLQSGSFIDHNHNILCEKFLDSKMDYCWWIDSDMTFPYDASSRLIGRQAPIAGATYRRRGKPFDLMGLVLRDQTDESGARLAEKPSIEDIRDNETLPAVTLPFGCLMVHREVILSMDYPWYENTYGAKTGDHIGGDTTFCEKAFKKGWDVVLDCALTRKTTHSVAGRLTWDHVPEFKEFKVDGPPMPYITVHATTETLERKAEKENTPCVASF